jgi:hypothetical protein
MSMSIVLLILSGLFTVFMAFGVANMYRNRKQAVQQYHVVLDRLNGRVEDRAKELEIELEDTYFTVTDMKEGILVGIAKKARRCIICTDRECHDFSFDALKACEVFKEEDQKPGWYHRLGLRLSLDGDQELMLLIGEYPRKETSYIGSMLVQNVESLKAYLEHATGKKKR